MRKLVIAAACLVALMLPPRAVATDVYPLQVNDLTRWYRVHLPGELDTTLKYPCVIVLHGAVANAKLMEEVSGMDKVADEHKFLAVYPNGTGKFSKGWASWNGGDCCGWAVKHKVDDITFLDRLISTLETQYPIDPARVYIAGFSNGAMLEYRAAAKLQDKVAAMGAVEASMKGDEAKPTVPMPMIIFHGTEDTRVPINGGGGKYAKYGNPVNQQPLSYAVKFWCDVNGCSSEPKGTMTTNAPTAPTNPEIIRNEYDNASGKPMVVVYKMLGGDHGWPGGTKSRPWGAPTAKNLNASEEMWKFFSEHTR